MVKHGIEFYKEYFKNNIQEIEESLEKVKFYSNIIDKQIKLLAGDDDAPYANRGSQMSLAAHMENAISLQVQRKELLKDLCGIKDKILRYSLDEEKSDSTEVVSLYDKLNEIVEIEKKRAAADKIVGNTKELASELTNKTSEELDAEIEKEINNGTSEND